MPDDAGDHPTDEPGLGPAAMPAVRPSTVTLPERPPAELFRRAVRWHRSGTHASDSAP